MALPSNILCTHHPKDPYIILATIRPEEGYYAGGSFHFELKFKPSYPFDPPKVRCLQCIFHPNIAINLSSREVSPPTIKRETLSMAQSGQVCLNILRLDWNPILSTSAILFGLLHLFFEPNANEPLNHGNKGQSILIQICPYIIFLEAGALLNTNSKEFAKVVKETMSGSIYCGVRYDNVVEICNKPHEFV